jgi:hypothetical protein
MNIHIKFSYKEPYLPTKRHRIPHYRAVEGETDITLRETTAAEAPVAFRVTTFGDPNVEYRLYDGKLWTPRLWSEEYCGAKGLYPVEELVQSLSYTSYYDEINARYGKDEFISQKENKAKHYLIVDGTVYHHIGEPRYCINTFGLGHNHGGTGFFVENWYNSNISKNNYFNALEREKAIAYGKAVAARRGDSESVESIGKYADIEVLIPDAVHCNPQTEHGEGDPFINQINAMINGTDSTNEAGILAIAMTLREINK